ncbi:MAG: hypothetical protein JWP16_1604 [Alphaproteobacteria bacterium]|nr:hypothetical protein [Alphaproteobacteria bacterium]
MPARDDVPTLCAIAVLAMIAATAAHEAIGHGGACLVAGGHIARLTSVYFTCAPPGRWIDAAGPLGNLACGAVAWLGLRLLPPTASAWRLFAYLTAAFSFYWFAGYLVYAMARDTGDYIFAVGPAPLGRAAEAVLGVALYLLTARLLGRQDVGGDVRRRAWLAATVAALLAALLYAPGRLGAAVQAGLEIGAASLPLLLRPGASSGMSVRRSPAWIGAGVILFAVFAVTLGRGLA